MNDEHITIETHENQKPRGLRTFTVYFFECRPMRVTVTCTPAVVRAWINKVRYFYSLQIKRQRLVVGLGVQWSPEYDSAATLQLCIDCNCLVFQLSHAPNVPISLRRFLSNPNHTFVGVWNSKDNAMLLGSDHSLSVSNLVDIRNVVEARMRNLSMEKLASSLLGFEGVEKPTWIGRSYRDTFWLSKEQIRYASVDAFLSFQLGKALHVWNEITDSTTSSD